MTEPQSPSPEQPSDQPDRPAQQPQSAPGAAQAHGAQQPGPYANPPGAPYAEPVHGGYGTFVAPPRPRVLWINPQRRTEVAGIAVAIALVFGGAGVAVGWAVSDHHDRGPARMRLAPPGYYGQYLPGPGRFRPNEQRPPAPSATPSSTTK